MEHQGDISDLFEILPEHIEFIDEPLEGFLRANDSGDLFAFRVSIIIPGLLWHWVLIPVTSTAHGVKNAFSPSDKTQPARWMSIVEDRRDGRSRLLAEWIENGQRLPANILDK